MKNDELRKNGSGYSDPTAYKALKNINNDEESRFYKLLDVIFDVCDLAGFRLEGRIAVRDKKTGRIWR